MKKGKLVPELRFLGFEGEWVEKKLSQLMSFKNGLNASKEDYGSGYKFINVLDIIRNDFITHDVILGSVDVSEPEFNKNIVEYGDILFQRSSETREEVGQANVYLDKEEPATFGGFVIRGKKIGDFDPVFLNALLKTSKSRKEITSKSGGSTRYNVGQGTLSEVPIHLPSPPEQQKIATFLTAIDRRIQLLQQKKAKLEAYKKGLMQGLFSGGMRFRDEKGGAFPAWEEKKLGEVLTYEQPGDYLVSTVEYNDKYKIPVLTAGKTFILGYTNETEGVFKERLPTIIFDDFTTAFKYVDFPFKAKSSAMKMLVPTNEKVNLKFVFEAMKRIQFPLSEHKRYWISEYQHEKIPYPADLKEQQKIATFLTAIDKSIATVATQIEHSSSYKKGLLQKMFV